MAFRFDEPLPDVRSGAGSLADPRWWRDSALTSGDISRFFADVDFGKLADRVEDSRGVPRTVC